MGGCAWGENFVVVVVVVVSGPGGVLLFGFLGSRWGCVLWCRGGGGHWVAVSVVRSGGGEGCFFVFGSAGVGDYSTSGFVELLIFAAYICCRVSFVWSWAAFCVPALGHGEGHGFVLRRGAGGCLCGLFCTVVAGQVWRGGVLSPRATWRWVVFCGVFAGGACGQGGVYSRWGPGGGLFRVCRGCMGCFWLSVFLWVFVGCGG